MTANARSIIAYAGVLLLACGDPTGPGSACEQTFEFGNLGCADVVGTVTDLSGQPLPGRSVSVKPVPNGNVYSGGGATTDQRGRFETRIWRMTQTMQPPVPDTFSVWVVATDLASAVFPNPATIRDSVLLRLTLTPIGRRPVAATAEITLPVE